jgi:phage-related tail fiber protein
MPAQQIQKGTTYANYPSVNSQVTAQNLNDHVDDAILLPGAISEQATSTPVVGDFVIAERTGSLFKYTLQSIRTLFNSFFMQLSGATAMTGPLILNNSTPASAATAASKGYVDSQVALIAGVPTGAIVMWPLNSVPAGWLVCAGQSTTGYAALAAIYGSNLPDLRGEFIRGADQGRGVDPGRTLLSFQAQDIQPHSHLYGDLQAQGYANGNLILTTGGTTASTSLTGNTETRPRNVAFAFIVKA